MLIVASVMMKLCRPVLAMRTPLTAPRTAPKAIAPTIASGSGAPACSISQPQAIALETPIAPTARLSPPVTMTTIMEKPIMMSIDIVRPSVNKLKGEAKPGVVRLKTMPNRTIRAKRPNSFVMKNRTADSQPYSGFVAVNGRASSRAPRLRENRTLVCGGRSPPE